MLEKEDFLSLLKDPLSEVTRKERRMLLIVSLAGIAITKAGLIPSQIRALGINFAPSDQSSLYFLVSAIVVYFIIAFFIYGSADLLMSLNLILKDRKQRVTGRGMSEYEENLRPGFTETELVRFEAAHKFQNSLTPIEKLAIGELTESTALLRILFEFVLPIGVGIYSTYLLIATSLALSTTAQ